MYATVSVMLAPGDRFGMTTIEAADAVLAALKGDPAVDTCTLSVSTATGVVGPETPEPPVVTPIADEQLGPS